MAYQFSLADVGYLAGPAGADALNLAAALAVTDATLLADLTAARRFAGGHAAAVVETVRLRRRAVGKLGERAAGWLLTDEALQQASPWPVARHRADRLVAAGVHDVTCSIGTDLAALNAAGHSPLLGSDLDPVRLAMAAFNLPGVPLVRADALAPVSRKLVVYADPARRSDGRRITSVSTVPSVAELDAAYPDRPPVLRLPPGIDYDDLDRPGEVEIVSLDGAAREAVLWPDAFAAGGVRRRASVLASDGTGWQITDLDGDGDDGTAAGAIDEWIVDPDPAVVRAHLVRHYAARHGLHQLDPHLAYLTGTAPPAGTRAFRVLDVAPYAEKTVAQWVRRDGVGTLEIKQRGTPVIPDELRRRLRKAMSKDTRTAATLVIARIGDAATAYWCRADPPAGAG
ncbi:THUMP-like domain-containing protein [Nakamurella lactea]|uniref:THUMP-like domain-containing protein n=1 Tax=Nakamurella lactea TaxID=459515 RepID=UPI0004107624|nr:hypothetical protein [Nakamurella lactea]